MTNEAILTQRLGGAATHLCNFYPNGKETEMEGVQENTQQPEHATIVRIDSVRFGDEEMANRVKLVCAEATGEFVGTHLGFWCNTQNQDGLLGPNMKLYQILQAAHGEGWTKKFGALETAIQALRGKYIAGTSVPKDVNKGGVGNNLKDATIMSVPEDFETAEPTA